ncbi:hypothetical protein CDAR_242071 [Caerostris darwini]|uniref:Uncharacterized protein n=1 Tax=Caerostris darwini TaxID=1538125 RepID=A0AAV4NLX6_9ARAC|nr:hypothetical protein CDAR_242071 [Caerostris darwini]
MQVQTFPMIPVRNMMAYTVVTGMSQLKGIIFGPRISTMKASTSRILGTAIVPFRAVPFMSENTGVIAVAKSSVVFIFYCTALSVGMTSWWLLPKASKLVVQSAVEPCLGRSYDPFDFQHGLGGATRSISAQ